MWPIETRVWTVGHWFSAWCDQYTKIASGEPHLRGDLDSVLRTIGRDAFRRLRKCNLHPLTPEV